MVQNWRKMDAMTTPRRVEVHKDRRLGAENACMKVAGYAFDQWRQVLIQPMLHRLMVPPPIRRIFSENYLLNEKHFPLSSSICTPEQTSNEANKFFPKILGRFTSLKISPKNMIRTWAVGLVRHQRGEWPDNHEFPAPDIDKPAARSPPCQKRPRRSCCGTSALISGILVPAKCYERDAKTAKERFMLKK